MRLGLGLGRRLRRPRRRRFRVLTPSRRLLALAPQPLVVAAEQVHLLQVALHLLHLPPLPLRRLLRLLQPPRRLLQRRAQREQLGARGLCLPPRRLRRKPRRLLGLAPRRGLGVQLRGGAAQLGEQRGLARLQRAQQRAVAPLARRGVAQLGALRL